MLSSAMDAIHAVSRAQYRAAFLDTYPLTCPTVHETPRRSHGDAVLAKNLTGNAVAYIRVSTGKQAKSGLGLEAQTEAIRAFAKTEGYKIAGSFEEHESGKGADALDRRPKLAAAIKAAKKAGGPVMVAVLSRDRADATFRSVSLGGILRSDLDVSRLSGFYVLGVIPSGCQ